MNQLSIEEAHIILLGLNGSEEIQAYTVIVDSIISLLRGDSTVRAEWIKQVEPVIAYRREVAARREVK